MSREASGTYCALALVDGKPGVLFEACDWHHAVEVAVECVKRCDPGSAAVTSDEEIRGELERDASWASNQGDIWVYILLSERFEHESARDQQS
jgi:hypothetical protein